MKLFKISTTIIALLLSLAITNANASNMTFSASIEHSLKLLKKSPYKVLTVQTLSGSFTGDFVSKTKDLIILKNKTNSIHMKSGKEKIQMTYIDIKSITAISVFVLDK